MQNDKAKFKNEFKGRVYTHCEEWSDEVVVSRGGACPLPICGSPQGAPFPLMGEN